MLTRRSSTEHRALGFTHANHERDRRSLARSLGWLDQGSNETKLQAGNKDHLYVVPATNLLSLLYSRAKSPSNRFSIKPALDRIPDVHYRYTTITTRILVSTSLLTYIVLRFYDNTSISCLSTTTTVISFFKSL